MRTKVRDIGNEETEKLLSELEKEVTEHYSIAKEELQQKVDKLAEKFEKKDKEMLKKLSRGSITEEEYNNWRKNQLLNSSWARDMRDVISEDLTNSNKIAMSIVNGYTPDVYALNMNYTTYTIEKQAKINTLFTLYNAQTVENLIREKPDLLPKARVNVPKDLRWNKRSINSAIIQGTLQGEGIPQIVKRLMNVTDMNKNVAIRNARTMVTAAQNMGREDSIKRAQDMGIDVERVWVATLDFRTRYSHRHLDGEIRAIDEPFSNGLMFPGDPDGAPEEVYNCRCREVATVYGFNPLLYARNRQNKLGDMSYEDWKAGKMPEPVTKTTQQNAVVNGKDITATWKRRPDMFDFEIEDAINAQGFDGLPRIVSGKEFDEMVKQANGGQGFIAQRTYSAPSQDILDEYRNQLYHGKWYVDCGTGGAQYGQGMYCAADYKGKLSAGIKEEMEHYIHLGETRTAGRTIHDLSEREQDQYITNIIRKHYGEEALKDKELRWLIQAETLPKRGGLNKYFSSFEEAGKAVGRIEKKYDPMEAILEIRTFRTEQYYAVETLTLDPSAKIVKYKDLRKEISEFEDKIRPEIYGREIEKVATLSEREKSYFMTRYGHLEEYGGFTNRENVEWYQSLDKYEADEIFHKVFDETRHIRKKLNDVSLEFYELDTGAQATLLGYDAINAEGHGQSGSYTVILNRTKVIIKGDN